MREETASRSAADRKDVAEPGARAVLYVLAIGTIYFAFHATAQTLFLETREMTEAILWHVLLAAGISLVGWAIAVGHSAWCNVLLAGASNEEARPILHRREFYAGWLQHVVLAVAMLDLLVLFSTAVHANFRGAPPEFLAAGLLLAVFFGLSGAVYASRVGTYLALISLGLFTVNLAAVVPWLGPEGGPADAAFLALLALLMTVLASFLWRRADEPPAAAAKASILPSPWARSPLPLPGETLRELWATPLAEVALFFGGLALALVAVRWGKHEEWPMLATFYMCTALCILSARLYRTPVLTYLAAGCLWASVYPLIVLLIASDPLRP